MKPLSALGLLLTAAFLAVLAAGCSEPAARQLDPPAASIQELLELRAERSTDASAYAEYFASVEVAQALAESAVEETQGPLIPEWDAPYVSQEESASADVVVVWRDLEDWPDWPVATVFRMTLLDDRWVAVDATGVEGTATPPPPRE